MVLMTKLVSRGGGQSLDVFTAFSILLSGLLKQLKIDVRII